MARYLNRGTLSKHGETMILGSYKFGSLLKEEYQKLEMYAKKTEEMYCNIFFPGSAVCACGKNLYSPLGSEFLTRDLIPIGELNRAIDLQVRYDNPHGEIKEEHVNTSALMWNEKRGHDALKDDASHILHLRKKGFIELEK